MTALRERVHAPTQTALNAVRPPEDYARVLIQEAAMDGEPIWHLRYEPTGIAGARPNLGGEHYSAVVTPEGTLKGVTWLDRRFAERTLPEAERAREVAQGYLRGVAPDLLDRIEVRWVRPHEERIRIANGPAGTRELSVTGMKVKCRNRADKQFFWVIVGRGETVLTFERDIVWNSLRQKRETEQWLHDTWLADRQA